MPTSRRTREHSKHVLLLAAIAAGGAAVTADAADAPPLPADFLEYLGSWEGNDADWLVANAAAVAAAPAAGTATSTQAHPTAAEKRGAARSPATTEHKP